MAPSGRSVASRERLSGGSARLTLAVIWKDKGNNGIHFPDPQGQGSNARDQMGDVERHASSLDSIKTRKHFDPKLGTI